MRTLVTGAAGFIGSHLCEALLADGHDVVAVDKLTDYYDPDAKRRNRAAYADHPRVELVDDDASSPGVLARLGEVDVVYHLAAQPGVRPSWSQFDVYLRENLQCTHRLLETARALPTAPRLVLASSSSVYGDAEDYPCHETSRTAPISPYGVSKQAMELLAHSYITAFALPVVLLRYFTVYGPRQRPDMAFHRFVRNAAAGQPLTVLGDGQQVRDFTYVGDVVDATVRAGTRDVPRGATYNVCGGEPVTIQQVIHLLEELVDRPVAVQHLASATGDVRQTGGSAARARAELGWRPQTRLRDGLSRQVLWHLSEQPAAAASELPALAVG